MTDREGRSELHYCALKGSAEQARALIDAGEDPNLQDNNGFSPLHFAAQSYNVDVAKELLKDGAQVDLTNSFGNTPLFVATANSRGRGDLIVLLRSAGANPLIRNASGQTPVGLARLIANYNVAQYFEDVE